VTPRRPPARTFLPAALLAVAFPAVVTAVLAVRLPPDASRPAAVVLGATLSMVVSALYLSDRLGRRVRYTLEEILDQLPGGVLLAGEGQERANREARRILGEDGAGRTEVAPFLDRALRDGGGGPEELLLPSPGGERTVRIAAVPVRLPGAKLLVSLRDVTEERRLARAGSDFAVNASHELRRPLSNVRGYLEAMIDARREGERADPFLLDVALQNARRMEAIIDDLIALARSETPKGALPGEPVPAGPFLREAAAPFRDEAERRGKRIVVEAGDETFTADRRRMALAVGNLVENAVRYGKDGGTVTLRAGRHGHETVLEVRDDGPGIPKEHLSRLFDRFYRTDRGRAAHAGGTGLGLSIVKHLVEAHGGTVEVESVLGEGTAFTIRLPSRQDR
jgi:signal transduction histidine kinase